MLTEWSASTQCTGQWGHVLSEARNMPVLCLGRRKQGVTLGWTKGGWHCYALQIPPNLPSLPSNKVTQQPSTSWHPGTYTTQHQGSDGSTTLNDSTQHFKTKGYLHSTTGRPTHQNKGHGRTSPADTLHIFKQVIELVVTRAAGEVAYGERLQLNLETTK